MDEARHCGDRCYAAVDVSSLTLADFPKDELRPCWENALACQIINAQGPIPPPIPHPASPPEPIEPRSPGCDTFDQEAVWRSCWLDNQTFSPKFIKVLEEAWKCETLQSIERSKDDLIRFL